MALSFLTEELNRMKLLLHGWQDREEVERTSSCRCRSDILREIGNRQPGAKSRGVSQRYKLKSCQHMSVVKARRLGEFTQNTSVGEEEKSARVEAWDELRVTLKFSILTIPGEMKQVELVFSQSM